MELDTAKLKCKTATKNSPEGLGSRQKEGPANPKAGQLDRRQEVSRGKDKGD